MTKHNSIQPTQKNAGFSGAVSHERHHRVAMSSLRDMIVFHHSLIKEMQVMEDRFARGMQYDRELYKKMVQADETYKTMMNGFMRLNDDQQCHAIIVFADAVKDLISFIHHKRKS